MFNKKKKAQEDAILDLQMEAFNRTCKLMGARVRVEKFTAFMTDKEGNRVVLPLQKLLVLCRVYIHNVLDYKVDSTREEMVEAKHLKAILDIEL